MNTDVKDVVATIESMMAAVGEDDSARLSELLSSDFHAFENGVRMSGPELLEAMRRNHAMGKRYKWSVTSAQVEVQGTLGAVTYVNIGSITETPVAEPVPQTWLETILLRREPSGWRVTFLHSTRAKAEASET